MELSKEQVNRIDEFLREQKVRHLDLRLELIDHLSTEIEENLKRVAIQSFDEAFTLIEKKYLPSLLISIKDQKQKSLNEYWNRRFKEFWKSYFTIPKIIITILLFVFFLSLKDIPFRSNSLLTGINILLNITGLLISLSVLCRSLLSSKRFIITETYAINLITPYIGLQFVHQLETIGNFSASDSLWLAILLSLANTIFTIGLIGHFTSFRLWIKEEIENTYPLIKTLG